MKSGQVHPIINPEDNSLWWQGKEVGWIPYSREPLSQGNGDKVKGGVSGAWWRVEEEKWETSVAINLYNVKMRTGQKKMDPMDWITWQTQESNILCSYPKSWQARDSLFSFFSSSSKSLKEKRKETTSYNIHFLRGLLAPSKAGRLTLNQCPSHWGGLPHWVSCHCLRSPL